MKKNSYKHSPEAIAKIIASNKRRGCSDETKRRIAEGVRKQPVIKQCLTCRLNFETRPFESEERLYCSCECVFKSPAYRDKHRNKVSHFASKEGHWNWKGGITSENEKIRASSQIRKWRASVLFRDNHECLECGETENLEVDHIKPFAVYPHLRFDVSNGRTLCNSCHKKTPTYAGRLNK